MGRVGVLLTAFGGPDCLDAVEPFMCALMGRQPSDEAVSSAKRRYLTIGGSSPLPAIAERIAARVERDLSGLERGQDDVEPSAFEGAFAVSPRFRASEGVEIPVVVGMCYSEPSIASGVERLIGDGVETIVAVSLSPFDAAVTTGAYRAALEKAVAGRVQVVDAAPYGLAAGLIDFLSSQVAEAMSEIDVLRHRALVVFSAHSLPLADTVADPSYVEQIRGVVAAVAVEAGIGAASRVPALPGIDAFGGPGTTTPWLLAFQSKGPRPGEWLAPDLDAVIDAAAEAGFAAVIVCPIGFATDHLETLYDIDVLAADRVLGAGMEFVRTAVPNDDPLLIAALADAVRAVV